MGDRKLTPERWNGTSGYPNFDAEPLLRRFAGQPAAVAARTLLEESALLLRTRHLVLTPVPIPTFARFMQTVVHSMRNDLACLAMSVASLYGEDTDWDETVAKLRNIGCLPSTAARVGAGLAFFVPGALGAVLGPLAEDAVFQRSAERTIQYYERRSPGFVVPTPAIPPAR